MDYEFKSLQELYSRIYPALKSKRDELKKIGYNMQEADIWNYLTDNKWQKSVELTLSEMVEDIFSLSEEDVANYMINKVSNRDPNLENVEILNVDI